MQQQQHPSTTSTPSNQHQQSPQLVSVSRSGSSASISSSHRFISSRHNSMASHSGLPQVPQPTASQSTPQPYTQQLQQQQQQQQQSSTPQSSQQQLHTTSRRKMSISGKLKSMFGNHQQQQPGPSVPIQTCIPPPHTNGTTSLQSPPPPPQQQQQQQQQQQPTNGSYPINNGTSPTSPVSPGYPSQHPSMGVVLEESSIKPSKASVTTTNNNQSSIHSASPSPPPPLHQNPANPLAMVGLANALPNAPPPAQTKVSSRTAAAAAVQPISPTSSPQLSLPSQQSNGSLAALPSSFSTATIETHPTTLVGPPKQQQQQQQQQQNASAAKPSKLVTSSLLLPDDTASIITSGSSSSARSGASPGPPSSLASTAHVPGSVAESHAATCLLVPANWAGIPKPIASQLKTSRFVVLGEVADDYTTLLNVVGSTVSSSSSASTAAASVSSASASVNGSGATVPAALINGVAVAAVLGHHLHFLRSARRLEKLGGMLREMVGTGKKVRDDATSALPDLGLDPSQLSSLGDGTDHAPNIASGLIGKAGGRGTTPSGRRPNLSLMSGLITQIEKGERDVNSVVKGVSPASALSSNTTRRITTGLHLSGSASSVGAATTSGSTPAAAVAQSLLQKYGKCQEIVGKGTYGTVRVSHKFDKTLQRETLYAVKEFRRRVQESEAHFSKRLTSEYCISSSLHDNNIIHTLDLMKDGRGEYCQVMEYCDGGDLYSLILSSEGGLKQAEADCFFKQLVRGVAYMHSMGVAHCDLKPENLLLTCNGALKVSDFGNAECFQMAWETEVHLSSGVCGSKPYIAPEQFKDREFDPRHVDVWATGVIYMVMRTGSYLWQVANLEEDPLYEKYLQGRKQKNGFEPIEALRRARCRNVIYSILDPIPSRRITAKQILNSEWGRSIHICEAGERGY